MLHGVTDSWQSFQGVLDRLPPDIRVYAISQRGHGNSSKPAAGYAYQDMAKDILAFVHRLQLPPVVVAGHSMGAMVAQQFAVDHPVWTAGLVLMAGWPSIKGSAVVREFVDSTIEALADRIDPAFVREFQTSTLAREVAPEIIGDAVAESLKVPARVWLQLFRGFLENDCSDRLGGIRVPALIGWGSRDSYAFREDQDALLAAIPAARFVVYEGAGHAFHWEDPGRFAQDLVGFLQAIV